MDHALRTGHAAILVLAVDMPWVETGALRRLADAWREQGKVSLAEWSSRGDFIPSAGSTR